MKILFAASILVLLFCFVSFAQINQTVLCPAISIVGPAGIVEPGEIAQFTAVVGDENQEKYIYTWTVQGAVIVEENGKDFVNLGKAIEAIGKTRIRFLISPKMLGEVLTATVEIKGLSEGCPNTASESSVFDPSHLMEVDDFIISATQIEKSKLNYLAKAAQENPSARIYIIEKFAKKTSPKLIELKSKND